MQKSCAEAANVGKRMLTRIVSRSRWGERKRCTKNEGTQSDDCDPACSAQISKSARQSLLFSRDANLLEADRAIFINGAKVIAPRKRKMNPAKEAAEVRGTVSYVYGQATGARDFVTPPSDGAKNDFILLTDSFDDASMPLRQPPTELDEARDEHTGGQDEEAKGKNVFLPVLNIAQHLFVARTNESGKSTLAGAEVQCPAQVMPCQNAATIHAHLRRWKAICCGGTGSRLDPDGTLEHALETHGSWVANVSVRDNLQTNDAVLFIDRKFLKAVRAADITKTSIWHEFTETSVPCIHHSLSLPARSFLDHGHGEDKLAFCLTRFGHVTNAGKTCHDLEKRCWVLWKDSFRYRQVAEMPPEQPSMVAKSRRILEESKGALDLTPQQEKELLEADNYDWELDLVWHICGPDCPVECNGSEERSCKLCWKRAKVAVCAWKQAPVYYRWKGMTEMLGFANRSVKHHRIVPRALALEFDAAKVEKAKKEIRENEARVAAGQDPLHMASQKQRVRGGYVASMMNKERIGSEFGKALTLHEPMEHAMNIAFASGKAVEDFRREAMELPAGATEEPAPMKEARAKATKLNLRFISGSVGDEAVEGMTELVINFDSPKWQRLDISDEEKFKSAETYIPAIAEMWMRMVFNFKHPKYLVMNASQKTEEEAGRAGADILRKRKRCGECLDDFSEIWSERLENPAKGRKAIDSLRNIIAATPLTAGEVERKHLIGQETRFKKRRGRGKTAPNLQAFTFRKSIRLHFERKRYRVEKSVLGDSAAVRQAYSRTLGSFEVGRAKRTRRNPLKAARFEVRQTQRKVDSFSRYVSRHAVVGPGTTMPQERKRLHLIWSNMGVDERAPYEQEAAAETQRLQGLSEHGFRSYAEGPGPLAGGGPRRKKRRVGAVYTMQRAAMVSVQAIKQHPSWSAGFRMSSSESAIKPDLIMDSASDAKMKEMLGQTFSYDSNPIVNPPGRLTDKLVCHDANSGCCEKSIECEPARNATKNMYAKFASRQLTKKTPFLVEVRAVDGDFVSSKWFFLARFFLARASASCVWRLRCILLGAHLEISGEPRWRRRTGRQWRQRHTCFLRSSF